MGTETEYKGLKNLIAIDEHGNKIDIPVQSMENATELIVDGVDAMYNAFKSFADGIIISCKASKKLSKVLKKMICKKRFKTKRLKKKYLQLKRK